jgi:DNA-binding transcriptional MerR regulator
MRQLGLFDLEPVKDPASAAAEPQQQSALPQQDALVMEQAEDDPETEEETLLDLTPAIVSLPAPPPAAKEPAPQKRGRKAYRSMEPAGQDKVSLPPDEELYKKAYYPIAEVAQWFNVNFSLLRYWETEFSLLRPRKNGKGDRFYSPQDVKNIALIYHLLRHRKYSIEGAREYLKHNRKKAENHLELINSLNRLKALLLEIKANLE